MAIYAIGDIQGCYKPLRRLLKKVDFNPAHDELWCVGDLINRGPDSLDTMRYLRELGDAVTVVLGNHDLHFLALYHGCVSDNGKHTLKALLKARDGEELTDWLRRKPLAYHRRVNGPDGEQDYLMIHAGVAPDWTLEKTLTLSGEVESVLHSKKYPKLLRHMYGNEPDRWDDGLQGFDRLRVIINYLTRLRFCDASGRMDFGSKKGLETAPEDCRPWFEFEQLTPQTTILFGHWAALEGQTGRPGVYALDTGYVWGRELTMMRLQDHQLFTV
ncbi:MAG: symmetrical bis(5'-nucleosyl)-tetraphosphatase [Pseudohongiellaceae bacterium]